jgi:DHA1 family tetracycline resistance protein-like MFS transporter
MADHEASAPVTPAESRISPRTAEPSPERPGHRPADEAAAATIAEPLLSRQHSLSALLPVPPSYALQYHTSGDDSQATTVFDGDLNPSYHYHPLGSSGGDDAKVSCISNVRLTLRTYKPAIKVGVFTFLMSVPGILTQPVLIEAKKDYFGSDQQAALVQSIMDCVTAGVNLLLVVLYGRLLDAVGRRPFFILSALFGVAAYVTLVAFPSTPIIFMLVSEAGNLVQSSFAIAYLSDLATPAQRPKFFALTAAVSTVVLLLGIVNAVVTNMNVRILYLVGAILSGMGLLFAVFFLPESLPKEKRTPLKCRGAANPLSDVSVMCKSRTLILCTVISVIVDLADIGVGDVYMFYLNQRVGFNEQDMGWLFVELSVIGPVCLLVALPLLLRMLSPSFVMSIALIGNAGVMVIIATIWAKWPIFAFAAPMAGIMAMVTPIIQATVTNTGNEADVARRVTALVAIGDLCSAIGPLPFGLLYAKLQGTLTAVPFFVSCGLCVLAAYLATRIAPAVESDVRVELLEEAERSSRHFVGEDDVQRVTEARLMAAALAPGGAQRGDLSGPLTVGHDRAAPDTPV